MDIAFTSRSRARRYLRVVPTPRALREQFDTYNRLFFHGALPPILLEIQHLPYWYGAWDRPGTRLAKGSPHGRIVITSALSMPRCIRWRGILLHEMLHAWLHFTDRAETIDQDTDEWHDHRFAAETRRIGRKLGLPDLPDDEAWAWPAATFELDWGPWPG